MKKEDLRIIKTKKNLYSALINLMQEKTFEDIKVLDICSKSLTNRSTFYDHFNDKYELLSSLIKDLEKELTEKLNKNEKISNPKEYFMNMIELFFDHINENISIYSPILMKNNNSIVMDMVYETCYRDVKEYMTQKARTKSSVPIDIIAKFYVSGVINICLEYVRNPKYYKKEDILEFLDILLPNEIY